MNPNRRYHTGLYQKIAAVVVFIILVTMVVPYLVFSHTSQRWLEGEIERQISGNMLRIVGYLEQNQLPLEDVSKLFGHGAVEMYLSDPQTIGLDDRQLAQLAQQDAVLLHRLPDGGLGAVLRHGERYVVCEITLGQIHARLRFAGVLSLAVSVLLGTGAMLFASHRITRSLRELDHATRKVAEGDFSQRVPIRWRNNEIAPLIESFNIMSTELGSVEMLRGNFISDISHEFKTPLTAIEGYAKLLDCTENAEERREYLQVITEETGRLCTLADNILMLNRIEKGNIPAKKLPVRVDEQIRHALALCEAGWTEKQLELELELDEIRIEAYDVLLMQLWTNLIDNAIKFSPVGGTITITLHRPEDQLVFSIEDQGEGIASVQQERIFDKFYKADGSRGTQGNGLGLSIVGRVVELHGGSIRVRSSAGEGARFIVTL